MRGLLRSGAGGSIQRARNALRVVPWSQAATTALLVPSGTEPVSAADVTACLQLLRSRGFVEARTPALGPAEQRPFREAGFVPAAELHLLERRLDSALPMAIESPKLRRPRRHEWDALVALDARAFDGTWRFDEDAINEALRATPFHRFRLAEDAAPLGYAIAGRNGTRGYIQRLAVDPDAAGRGVGSTLLLDALRWLRARGARTALVNTMLDNHRALALYDRHGFELRDERLAVLRSAAP